MLSVTIPRVQSYAPETALFDLSPAGYTHSQALTLLESLGRAGRDTYLFPQLALDFVYPGLFAACFSLMLIWLYSKRIRPDSKWLYLAVIPVLGGLFDFHRTGLELRCLGYEIVGVRRYIVGACQLRERERHEHRAAW